MKICAILTLYAFTVFADQVCFIIFNISYKDFQLTESKLRKILNDNRELFDDMANRNPDRWRLGYDRNLAHLKENPSHQLNDLDPVLDHMF